MDGNGTTASAGTVTFLDLFAGIGAMRLGFERACKALGMESRCVGFSEIDPRAIDRYLRHFPDTKPLGDVRNLAAPGAASSCDVILGGFPCQDASMAGKRLGLEGERGRLFYALADVIAAVRPVAFLLENVRGLLSLDGGNAMRTVLTTLAGLGYEVRPGEHNSRDFGVPQNRPRVYIVGFKAGGSGFRFPVPTDSTRRLKDVLETNPIAPRYFLTEKSLARIRAHKARHEDRGNGFGAKIIDAANDVAGTLTASGWGPEHNLVVDTRLKEFAVLPGRKSPLSRECVRKLTPMEWERLQGVPDGYTAGQADGHRYRQLGNAVTVDVIEAVARNMLEAVGVGASGGRAAPSEPRPCGSTSDADGALNVLDLFAGCGGLSTGFVQAGGFKIVAACEANVAAAATLARNYPGTVVVQKDITAEATIREVCAIFGGRRCGVVMGGVPCQAYTKSKHRDPNDPRGKLYEPFMEVVRRLMPLAVVIENVPDIMTAIHVDGTLVSSRIASMLGDLGYAAGYYVLNAADFGVPQRRMRAFIFGWRQGHIPMPRPTHDALGRDGLPHWLTVRDAIGDLEEAPEDKRWSHVFTRHTPRYLERLARTPVGGKAAVSYNEGGYRNPPDLPCRTLRGGAWPIHYRHHRVITPREGARLQGFPDSFEFVGSKTEVMLQIGNAVPPPLAKAVGLAVLAMLGKPTSAIPA